MKRQSAHAVVLLLFAAAAIAVPVETVAKPRDAGVPVHDRILVTLEMAAPNGVASLSPSGRLNYLPPTAEDVRRAHVEKAERLAIEHGLELEADWPIPALDVYCFVFRVSTPEKRAHILSRLAQLPDIESVQPLQFFHGAARAPQEIKSAAAAAGDPLSNWNETLNRQLVKAHVNATGKNVTIAVIDTGADLTHEDLVDATIIATDFVDERIRVPEEAHGTAVVGLLAARPGNEVGMRGYAPDARILLLRACWEPDAASEAAVCNSFTLAKAMSHALASDATIINLSISGPRDPLLERLAEKLVRDERLLIVAGESRTTFPASVPGSIVASEQVAKKNGGTEHSFVPALTLLPDDRYGLREGTSITTAQVTGVAALMRERDPTLTVGAFRERLHSDEAIFAELSQLLHAGSIPPVRPVAAK